jgi:hypothetical protein
MTLFSVILVVLLLALVLAVSAGVTQLHRQAVAQEAIAEAVGSLLDVRVAEAERDASLVMAGLREAEANLPPEGYPVTLVEEDTKPDHPKPLLAPCSRCGQIVSLCHCKLVRS